MRLDKYLKVSRLIKRRTIANEACDKGLVSVKEGDRISLKLGPREVTVEVVSVQDNVRQSEAGLLYKEIREES